MKKYLSLILFLTLIFYGVVSAIEEPTRDAQSKMAGKFHLPHDLLRTDGVQTILQEYRNVLESYRTQIHALKTELEAAAVAEKQDVRLRLHSALRERHQHQRIFRKNLRRLVRDFRHDRLVSDRPAP